MTDFAERRLFVKQYLLIVLAMILTTFAVAHADNGCFSLSDAVSRLGAQPENSSQMCNAGSNASNVKVGGSVLMSGLRTGLSAALDEMSGVSGKPAPADQNGLKSSNMEQIAVNSDKDEEEEDEGDKNETAGGSGADSGDGEEGEGDKGGGWDRMWDAPKLG
jgi:hypothetical protein